MPAPTAHWHQGPFNPLADHRRIPSSARSILIFAPQMRTRQASAAADEPHSGQAKKERVVVSRLQTLGPTCRPPPSSCSLLHPTTHKGPPNSPPILVLPTWPRLQQPPWAACPSLPHPAGCLAPTPRSLPSLPPHATPAPAPSARPAVRSLGSRLSLVGPPLSVLRPCAFVLG